MIRRFISGLVALSFLLWNLSPDSIYAQSPHRVVSVNSTFPPSSEDRSKTPIEASEPASSLFKLGADCGPKVLQKILAQMGQDVSLAELIQATQTIRGQTGLEGLRKGAQQQGLWALGIKTDSQTLEKIIRSPNPYSLSPHFIAHVGGNKHYVWIQEVNDKWVKGYNPAVSHSDWRFPRKVFDRVWKGEGLVVWYPSLLDWQLGLMGLVRPVVYFPSNIQLLTSNRMCRIWGGASCQNSTSNGGQAKGGAKTGEPVEIANGDLVMAAKDISIESLGPDLTLERNYHVQLSSDIEGWEPEEGTTSWAIENGVYAAAGDRSGTTQEWEDFIMVLTMQTIEPGTSYDYEVAWVNFRYQDEDNRYYFLIKTDGTMELAKYKGGVQSSLVTQASSYDPLTAHSIQIQVEGDHIQIYIDSALAIDTADPDPLTGAGKIVLESYYCHAHYDDIGIIDLASGTLSSWDFNEDDNDGMFGRGWRSDIETSLIFQADGDILVRRGNDRRDTFTWDATLSTWTAESGIWDGLAQSGTDYTLTQKDGSFYQFDSNGKLTSIEDRYGNTLTFTYTTAGSKERVSQMTDATGRSLSFSYDTNAHCAQVTDPLGRTITYTYTSDGLLETAQDPRGNTRQYGYDSHHRLTQYTDRNGNHYQYGYAYNNRTLTQTDPGGNVTSFDYQWEVTQVTDAGGNVWTYEFDWKGTLISQTDPEGNEMGYDWGVEYFLNSSTDANGDMVQYTYDENGNMEGRLEADGNWEIWSYETTYNQPITHMDKNANWSYFSYDTQGNLTQLTDALSYTATMSYNTQGQVTSLTDKRGNTSTFTYDSYGYPDKLTDAQSNVTDYDYDQVGRLTQTTNALGYITQYQYDDNGNVTSITDPEGHITTYTYDANDNKTSITDPLSQVTSMIYNAYDKISTMSDPLGRTTSYSYDVSRYMLTGAVDLIQIQDPAGYTTDYTLDGLGRITQLTDALSNTTSYIYDTEGNLTSITDANGNATQYSYDSLDRLSEIAYADSSIETNTYDAYGNITQKILRDGSTLTYTYNARNENTQRATSDGTTDAYTYDANSNLTQITRNSADTWTYSYDTLNRVTQTTDSDSRTIGYGYDALGRRISLTYPDSMQVTYTYDNDSLLTQITEGGRTRASYTYDESHRRTERSYNNGVTATYTYDEASELTELLNATSTGTTLSSFSYSYDSLGNRTQQVDLTGTNNYSYDAISQLTQALYASGTQQDYTYDPVQSRKELLQATSTTTYSVNSLNQITEAVGAAKTVNYQWDVNGNLSQRQDGTNIKTYTHNDLNQLTQVSRTGKSAVSYTYDPLGRRISKTVGSTIFYYTWDGDQLIELRNSSGTVLQTYIYGVGLDEPILMKKGTKRFYYSQDGLGSISELTNSSGSKIESYLYDVYGKPTIYSSTGTIRTRSSYNNPYYFTAREYDTETGLYYYRARYYDPSLGRFLETDPLGYVDSLNLYSYVGNNPWNYIDPFGLKVVNNSSEYVIVKLEAGNSYVILPPGETEYRDQDGVIFDDGSIFKNNTEIDVELVADKIVSEDSIDDNWWGDFLKVLYNSYWPFKDEDLEYSGWYEMGDETKTGQWNPGELLLQIQNENNCN